MKTIRVKEELKNEISLREKSLEWFFSLSEAVRRDLKDIHFKNTPIEYSSKWGYHFTFGQIEEMFNAEIQGDKIKIID